MEDTSFESIWLDNWYLSIDICIYIYIILIHIMFACIDVLGFEN